MHSKELRDKLRSLIAEPGSTQDKTLKHQWEDIHLDAADFFKTAAEHGYRVRLKAAPEVGKGKRFDNAIEMAKYLFTLSRDQDGGRLGKEEGRAKYGESLEWKIESWYAKREKDDGKHIRKVSLDDLHRWAIATTGEGLEIYYHRGQI